MRCYCKLRWRESGEAASLVVRGRDTGASGIGGLRMCVTAGVSGWLLAANFKA